MADLIWVNSTLPKSTDGGDPAALWERDPRHPGGEVFVAGVKAVQVAQTAAVTRLIRAGILQQVSGGAGAPSELYGDEEPRLP